MYVTKETPVALVDVELERARQEKKWGPQNRCPLAWIAIVAEELGEAAKHALQIDLNWENMIPDQQTYQIDQYYKEMTETAAVAVAAMEAIQRAQWKPRELRNMNPDKPEN